MTAFLCILAGLTLALTLSGSAALLLRRTRIGRVPGAMGAIWAAVLLLCVVPLYLPIELPDLTPAPPSVQDIDTPSPGPAHPAADLTVEQRPAASAPSDTAHSPATTVFTRRPAPAFAHSAALVPAVCAMWAIGVAAMIAAPLCRNRRLSAMLRACSTPCTDTDLLAELIHLADRAGLREPPELRILDTALPLPPCTAGFASPHIYLPANLPDEPNARAAILAHELCHIRRRDIARKLIALGVLSLHWFNPLAHALLPRMYEDLEPACDRDALTLLGGEDVRLPYMQTILDVARATRAPAAPATMFFAGSAQTKRSLERRFIAMKTTRYPTLTHLVTITLVLALTLLSAATFTACAELTGLDVLAAAEGSDLYTPISPLAKRIVRYHYDLAPEDEITNEMLGGITSLKLSVAEIDRDPAALEDLLARAKEPHTPDLNEEGVDRNPPGLSDGNIEDIEKLLPLLGEKTLVSFEVNTRDAAPGSKEALRADRECLTIVPRNFYDTTLLAPIKAAGTDSADFDSKKVDAYYTRKDVADAQDERARAELIAAFPGIEQQAFYLQDPTMSIADYAVVYSLMAEYGVLEPQLLDSTVIDTAALYAIFPNLTSIELVGLTEK